MYIRNAWYVAAWDREIGRDMLRRIILEEPVVLYRREDGTPVALEDRCIHRQSPLSLGKLKGDIVECPYHGLQFDPTGQVVCIPSQTNIPKGARVRSYPVVERNHWIWIWMGEPALADPAKIEDFHWLDDPDWRFGGDKMMLDGNYLLLIDNLLDTTHLPYVHPESLGTDDFAGSECEYGIEQDSVEVARYLMDRPPAPFHRKMADFPDGAHVDRWQIARFTPPALVRLDVGSALAGTAKVREGERGQGMNMWNLNALTPETAGTTHYFWAQAYNFRLDQEWMAENMRAQVHAVFSQDLAIIKAQQRNIDLGEGRTIDLGQDAGGIAARRIVQRLIDAEHASGRSVAAE